MNMMNVCEAPCGMGSRRENEIEIIMAECGDDNGGGGGGGLEQVRNGDGIVSHHQPATSVVANKNNHQSIPSTDSSNDAAAEQYNNSSNNTPLIMNNVNKLEKTNSKEKLENLPCPPKQIITGAANTSLKYPHFTTNAGEQEEEEARSSSKDNNIARRVSKGELLIDNNAVCDDDDDGEDESNQTFYEATGEPELDLAFKNSLKITNDVAEKESTSIAALRKDEHQHLNLPVNNTEVVSIEMIENNEGLSQSALNVATSIATFAIPGLDEECEGAVGLTSNVSKDVNMYSTSLDDNDITRQKHEPENEEPIVVLRRKRGRSKFIINFDLST